VLTKGPWGIAPAVARPSAAAGWISPARYEGLEPPRREWMVEGCFARGTVGMLSGDGDIGKSTLMLQLCCSAALGTDWIGLAVKPGRALYMGCEDDGDELWRRGHAIVRSAGRDMAELGERLEWASFVGQDARLISFERFTREPKPTAVYRALERHALSFGAEYIVIDTATKTFSGNQNDELQVDAYISLLRRLAISIQGCVIVTKHPSLSGRALGSGESGNVAWNNSVRARLYFRERKAGGERARELVGMKANYGPRLPAIPLRWERGVFVREELPLTRHWSEVDQ
jgi:RecA-family ATPase